jgi:hypothetical protein
LCSLTASVLIGYFNWNCARGFTFTASFATVNAGIHFTGLANLPASTQAASFATPLKSGVTAFITVGGGHGGDGTTHSGGFNDHVIQTLDSDILSGKATGYSGTKIPLYSDTNSPISSSSYNLGHNPFSKLFTSAKSVGLKVIVTTSGCAPYGYTDGQALATAWMDDPNVTYLAPQLFSIGLDYLTPCRWWAGSDKVVPVILFADYATEVDGWASSNGLTWGSDYILWCNNNICA